MTPISATDPDLSTFSTSQNPSDSDTGVASNHPWPEPYFTEPRPAEPFPWNLFAKWLLPATVILILLTLPWLYFNQRADRLIVAVSPENKLTWRYADNESVNNNLWVGNNNIIGPLRWSPNGQQLATLTNVSSQNSDSAGLNIVGMNNSLLVFVSEEGDRITELPDNAWSADGQFITALGRDGESNRQHYLLGNIAQQTAQFLDIPVGAVMSLDWHPQTNELLVTGAVEAITPTLYIVQNDGITAPLELADELNAHMTGVWSPNGGEIAYVAYQQSEETITTSEIWIARRDGSNPRQLTSISLDSAPVWSPQGDFIFFTRYHSETEEYDLYRVGRDGRGLVRVGWGFPPNNTGLLQKGTPIAWSEDGTKLFFLGVPPRQQQTVYVALADGSDPQPVFRTSDDTPLQIQWAPTNRALLIGAPTETISLVWISNNRTDTLGITGTYPAWQPQE